MKPFSRHTFEALITGSSQLISQISTFIPGIFLRRLIGLSLNGSSEYDNAMAAFNVLSRFVNIVVAVILAFCTGFLPAASYAFAAKKYKRYLRLALHLNWITFAWCIIMFIFGMWYPVQIAKIFGSGDDFIRWNILELPNSNWGTIVFFVRYTFQTMLQSQQRGKRSMIISFTSNFVVTIATAYMMYYIDTSKTERILWSFCLSSYVGMILGTILLAKPLLEIFRESKQNNEEKESTTKSDQEIDDEDSDVQAPIHEL